MVKPQYISSLHKEGNCVDVQINCKDGEVTAHRLILASSSPLLTTLLQGQTAGELVTIILPDINVEPVHKLIDVFYNGEQYIDRGSLEDIMCVAKLLGMVPSYISENVAAVTTPRIKEECDEINVDSDCDNVLVFAECPVTDVEDPLRCYAEPLETLNADVEEDTGFEEGSSTPLSHNEDAEDSTTSLSHSEDVEGNRTPLSHRDNAEVIDDNNAFATKSDFPSTHKDRHNYSSDDKNMPVFASKDKTSNEHEESGKPKPSRSIQKRVLESATASGSSSDTFTMVENCYTCKICGLRLGRLSWMLKHSKKCKKPVATCTGCKKPFYRFDTYSRHTGICKGTLPAKQSKKLLHVNRGTTDEVKAPNNKFGVRLTSNQHLASKSSMQETNALIWDKYFKECYLCNTPFKTTNHLGVHISTVHKITRLEYDAENIFLPKEIPRNYCRCPYCPRILKREAALQQHLWLHNQESRKRTLCVKCNHLILNNYLSRHKCIKSGTDKRTAVILTPKKTVPENELPETPSKVVTLRMFPRAKVQPDENCEDEVDGEEEYQCSFCENIFLDERCLVQHHKECRKSVEPMTHTCKKCKSTFQNNRRYQHHVKMCCLFDFVWEKETEYNLINPRDTDKDDVKKLCEESAVAHLKEANVSVLMPDSRPTPSVEENSPSLLSPSTLRCKVCGKTFINIQEMAGHLCKINCINTPSAVAMLNKLTGKFDCSVPNSSTRTSCSVSPEDINLDHSYAYSKENDVTDVILRKRGRPRKKKPESSSNPAVIVSTKLPQSISSKKTELPHVNSSSAVTFKSSNDVFDVILRNNNKSSKNKRANNGAAKLSSAVNSDLSETLTTAECNLAAHSPKGSTSRCSSIRSRNASSQSSEFDTAEFNSISPKRKKQKCNQITSIQSESTNEVNLTEGNDLVKSPSESTTFSFDTLFADVQHQNVKTAVKSPNNKTSVLNSPIKGPKDGFVKLTFGNTASRTDSGPQLKSQTSTIITRKAASVAVSAVTDVQKDSTNPEEVDYPSDESDTASLEDVSDDIVGSDLQEVQESTIPDSKKKEADNNSDFIEFVEVPTEGNLELSTFANENDESSDMLTGNQRVTTRTSEHLNKIKKSTIKNSVLVTSARATSTEWQCVPKFQCPCCSKQTTRKYNMALHLKHHAKSVLYKCLKNYDKINWKEVVKKCNQSKYSQSKYCFVCATCYDIFMYTNIKKHIEEVHPPYQIVNVIAVNVSLSNNLDEELSVEGFTMETEEIQNPMEMEDAPNDEEEIPYPSTRLVTVAESHKVNILRCPLCRVLNDNVGSMRHHLTFVHAITVDTTYFCAVCKTILETDCDSIEHLINHAKNLEDATTGTSILPQENSASVVFASTLASISLPSHEVFGDHLYMTSNWLSLDSDSTTYNCCVCNKSFNEKTALTKHLDEDHTELGPE